MFQEIAHLHFLEEKQPVWSADPRMVAEIKAVLAKQQLHILKLLNPYLLGQLTEDAVMFIAGEREFTWLNINLRRWRSALPLNEG
jgi:hypothetical protein